MFRCCSNCKFNTVIYEKENEEDEATGYPSCENPDSKNYQCYIPDDYVCSFFKEKDN